MLGLAIIWGFGRFNIVYAQQFRNHQKQYYKDSGRIVPGGFEACGLQWVRACRSMIFRALKHPASKIAAWLLEILGPIILSL